MELVSPHTAPSYVQQPSSKTERSSLLSASPLPYLAVDAEGGVGGSGLHGRSKRDSVKLATGLVAFLCVASAVVMVLTGDSERQQQLAAAAASSSASSSSSFDVPFPFEVVERQKLVPSAMWGGDLTAPYPSGAWWSNLAVGKGDQVVAALPYQYKIDPASFGGGLQVSYGPLRRTASDQAASVAEMSFGSNTTFARESDVEVEVSKGFRTFFHEVPLPLFSLTR